LTEAIKRYGHKNAQYIGPLEGAPEMLRDQLREGDMFITLGAGTVYRAGEQMLALLREQTGDAKAG
jgi:UDP-N-acetylmuramate--alanine ligase